MKRCWLLCVENTVWSQCECSICRSTSCGVTGFPHMHCFTLVFYLCQSRGGEVSFSYSHTSANVNQAHVNRSRGIKSEKGHGTRLSLSMLNGVINNKSPV